MKPLKMFTKLILACGVFAFANSVHAYTYGCGFISGGRQGQCVTVLDSSEFGTYRQVAVRVSQAKGETYDFHGSFWALARSYAVSRYNLPSPWQFHTIAGDHCVQYYGYAYKCVASKPYSAYL